ncbi:MAG: hypothetical protein ACO23K_03325 [Ilumatobacteraceae bacterium]
MTLPTNPPANPVPGAVYIDLATNYPYIWTGTSWVRTSGTSTAYNSQITTGATILPGYFSAPNPKDYLPQIGSAEPASPYPGQLWTDTNQTPSPTYIWDSTQWVIISDGATSNTTVGAMPPADPDSGDTYFETTTNRLYVWSGTTWALVNGEDTHAFSGTGVPTLALRPDNTALRVGDQYLETTTPRLYTWTGATWSPLVGGDGTTASNIIPFAVEPAVPLKAAIYYNTTDDRLYYADGTSWVDVSGVDSHSFTGSGAPTLATRPDGRALVTGDHYVDTDTSLPYYWNGTSWGTLATLSGDFSDWTELEVPTSGNFFLPTTSKVTYGLSDDTNAIKLPDYASTPYGFRVRVVFDKAANVNVFPLGSDLIRGANAVLSFTTVPFAPIEIWRQNLSGGWMVDGHGTH